MDQSRSTGCSFLDLPQEIRDCVYQLCLTAPDPIIPRIESTIVIDKFTCVCYERHRKCSHLCGRSLSASERLEIHYYPKVPPGLSLALLRVNKQIHTEAVRILYGDNTFEFYIGLGRAYDLANFRSMHHIREQYNLIENFSKIGGRYLRMIKRCTLNIRIVAYPVKATRLMYQYMEEDFNYLAAVLRRGHSLRTLNVTFNQVLLKPAPHKHGPGYFQNVLEPLGTIQGIPRVTFDGSGMEPAFASQMTYAMRGKHLACVPVKIPYGIRRLKNGKKRGSQPQRYKLAKFYDSKYIWHKSIAAAPCLYEWDQSICESPDTKV